MMKEFDVKLGRILRTERESHGVTQQEMAKALGCTNVAVLCGFCGDFFGVIANANANKKCRLTGRHSHKNVWDSSHF